MVYRTCISSKIGYRIQYIPRYVVLNVNFVYTRISCMSLSTHFGPERDLYEYLLRYLQTYTTSCQRTYTI